MLIRFFTRLLSTVGCFLLSTSIALHRHFQTPWWQGAEEGIKAAEERLEEWGQLEAMNEEV